MKNIILSTGIVGLLVVSGFMEVFIAINPVSASGPTYVSGLITSDETWDLPSTPYILTGDVTVESGVTLTIEPGVEVKFDGVYSIVIDGKLIADGTSLNKIKFTSNQTSAAKGDWYTIRLRTGNNLIDYAEVEYASYGVFMTFFGTNNTISNTTIKYCKYDGIYIKNSDNNTISNCTITSNDRFGITIYESYSTKVDNSIIQNNNFFGINLNASTYTQIYDCNVSYNDGKGILLYSNSHHTTISDCEIEYNNHIGIDLSGTSNNDIIDTRVCGNKYIGIDFGGKTTNQWIENCYIINNEGTGIDLRGSSYVDIVGCNISQNKNKGGIYSAIPVNHINITNTEIFNNSAGNGIDFYGASFVNITGSKIIANVGNGINFNGDYIQENNSIKNCKIAENSNNGILFYAYNGNGNAYLQNNNIFSNTIYSNDQNGIYFHAYAYNHPFYTYCYLQNNNVYTNTLYSNKKNGIYFSTYISLFSRSDIQNNNIYSNSIYLNDQNGIYFFSYILWDNCNSFIQKNNLYSNNIYLNTQNGVYFYADIDGGSSNSYYLQNNNIHSNNIFQHSIGSGIYLQANNPVATWQPSNLYNNTITSNLIGIRFLRIKSQVIYTNNISNNHHGILLDNSTSNTLRYNTITNNNWSGINLTNTSSNNNIENNVISFGNQTGIFISSDSNNNLLTRNDIMNNSKVGLKITGASGNQVNHNNFIDNTQNAFDSTIALNDWDDGVEGNYWSDYLGTDDDGDGFGEDPYVIPGGGSRDWHPFMNPLDISAPYVISTLPANGDGNVPVDTKISVIFSKEMNTTAVESAISISGGLFPIGFLWDIGNEIVTFSLSSNLTSKTTYTVTITTDAKDRLGNWMEDTYMFSFTSEDIDPPKISVTLPFNGETNVEINADIVVIFNEPMQISTVTYSCIPDPDGWNVSWTSENTIASFSHNDFGSEITYTFQITTGKDTANLNLVAGPVPNPWSFTTKDILGPEITSTSPADGSQNISTIANIIVNFNEKMDNSSLTYTCTPDPLGWSVVWTNEDKTATFSHNEFTQKIMYTFEIMGAKDISGNDLNPNPIPNPWSFTTTGDYTAPQIILTSPADNAVNVNPSKDIVVTFSEAMDTSSLNYICIPDPGGWSESWSAGNTVIILSHNPFESSKIYEFQITGAKDLVNYNLIAGAVPNPWSFQIADVVSPKILSTSPSNCAENVVQTANVVVKFSEEMETSSLSFICNPNPGDWSVLWSSGNTIATFTHNPFDSMTNYTFHIIEVKDLAGNDLVSDSIQNPWWFVTIDSEGPLIISTSPVNGASNIGLENTIVVTFNEQVDFRSVTFTCAPDPGGWDISWSAVNTVAILSHNPFSESIMYTFHITSARDLTGNNLGKGIIPNPWTFTTFSVNSLTVTPSVVNIAPNETVTLEVQAFDLHNNPIADVTYLWSVDNNLGIVLPQGEQIITFKASSNVGTCYVNVTAGGKNASVLVTIKSDDLSKDETKESLPEDMIWISFLWLVIITACIVFVLFVLWKKGAETEEGPESIGSVTSEEPVDESQEATQDTISEPTPLSPQPTDDSKQPPSTFK